MKRWLADLARVVAEKIPKGKRDAYATGVGLSRQQLSIIEHASRDYGIESLLRALAGPEPYGDPLEVLLSSWKGLAKIDSEAIKACRNVVVALTNPHTRAPAKKLLSVLEDLVPNDDAADRAPPIEERAEG